jgi:hypothetical protein
MAGIIVTEQANWFNINKFYRVRGQRCSFKEALASPPAPWGTSPVGHSWKETLIPGFPPTLASLSASFPWSIWR